MRILQLCPFLHSGIVSGVANHVLNLSKRLKRLGHYVVVYSALASRDMPRRELFEGIPVHHLAVARVPGLRAGYIPTPSWLRITALEQFDVIHAHSLAYFPSYTAAVASILSHRPFVLTAHQPPTDAAFENKPLASIFNFGPGRLAIHKASRVIALTNLEATYLQRKYALRSSRISVIPNGVELETFRPVRRSGPSRTHSVLYVGRFSDEKGIFDLLRAVPHVLKRFPDARFTFVGDEGRGTREVVRAAHKMGVSRNIVLLGARFGPALADTYTSADLFVAPSVYETFGIAILEAMAVGLPVVATAVGGIPELLEDTVNGILVQPSDHRGLAEAIVEIFSNHELAAKISCNNVAKAKSYSWQRIAEDVHKVYVQVLEADS